MRSDIDYVINVVEPDDAAAWHRVERSIARDKQRHEESIIGGLVKAREDLQRLAELSIPTIDMEIEMRRANVCRHIARVEALDQAFATATWNETAAAERHGVDRSPPTMSHDPTCDACGIKYDEDLSHVCDPLDLVASLREEFRAALQAERSRIARILRGEVASGANYLVVAAVRRIADAIEEES